LADTRDIALSVLMDIETKGTYSNIALSAALKKNQFSEKADRAFITRLTEGTVESQITLDYIINQFSKTKVNKCKPLIRCLLRLSVYQIIFMDKVPDSAACNEAVKLAKKHGFSSLSGFVNGVLRNISRNKESIKYPYEDDGNLYYSVKYSVPGWLCEKLIKDYPEHYKEIFEGCFSDRKTTIRVNETRTTKEELRKELEETGVTVSDGLYSDRTLLIDNYDFIRKLPGYRQGYFTVQDESSVCAVLAAEIKPGDTVLDVCAAPGGKSTLAAELLKGDGRVYSMDISGEKLELIEENASRLGLENIVDIRQNDATVLLEEFREKADVVIADVPCSGLGIIGRKNDIKYRLTPDQMNELVKLQREILKTVSAYVKPGGRMLFSTCTINPDENEKNRDWILENISGFTLLEEHKFLQGVDECDGFYYAVFYKNNSTDNHI
jgi:16S rRNA (cytosine967-C5)-methyltransferase